jgi:hypothetical protein
MDKLKVCAHNLALPTVGFVNKEGAMHVCAQAQKTAFLGLDRNAALFGNRCLSDEDREILMKVESFCKNNGLEYEIVDI